MTLFLAFTVLASLAAAIIVFVLIAWVAVRWLDVEEFGPRNRP